MLKKRGINFAACDSIFFINIQFGPQTNTLSNNMFGYTYTKIDIEWIICVKLILNENELKVKLFILKMFM